MNTAGQWCENDDETVLDSSDNEFIVLIADLCDSVGKRDIFEISLARKH